MGPERAVSLEMRAQPQSGCQPLWVHIQREWITEGFLLRLCVYNCKCRGSVSLSFVIVRCRQQPEGPPPPSARLDASPHTSIQTHTQHILPQGRLSSKPPANGSHCSFQSGFYAQLRVNVMPTDISFMKKEKNTENTKLCSSHHSCFTHSAFLHFIQVKVFFIFLCDSWTVVQATSYS